MSWKPVPSLKINRENTPLKAPGNQLRFRRLVLQGFKSFPDRTELDFGAAVCAVVGPNGCGKSNILDALRWVLGEQGPSQLRAKGMQDIIFTGSTGRRPLGMAEVSLTVECPAASLPIGFEEVEVTRRLYRSGESEYRLNRTPCRLKDITDLFLDTGVGKGAYSLIEQGRVDALITARPEDRRGLIEQVAGIQKYKVRKREALSKLESTRRNLTRIQDVVSELRSRRIILARQANKASKYRKIREERDELERLAVAGRYGQLRDEKYQIEKIYVELENSVAKLSARTGLQAATLQNARDRVDESEQTLNKIRLETEQIDLKIDYLETRIGDLDTREKEITAEIEGSLVESEDLALRRTSLDTRKVELEGELKTLADELSSLGEMIAVHESLIQDTDTEIQDRKSRIQSMKSIQMQAMETASRIRNRHAKIDEAVRRVQSRMDTLGREFATMRLEENAATENARRTAEHLTELEQTSEDVLSRLESVTEQCMNRQRSQDEIYGRIQEVEARLVEARSRLQSLEEVMAAGEGLGDGVKAILHDFRRRPDVNGHIVGVLADLFEVEARYERALTAALESRIQDVVVRNTGEVEKAIRFLSSEQRGRCTFIPVKPRAIDRWTRPEHLPEDARPVAELIRVESEFEPLFTQILNRTYLVDSLPEAMAAWEQEPSPVTLVTLEGEVVSQEGCVTGGLDRAAQYSYRSRKQEITLLKTDIAVHQTRFDDLSLGYQEALELTREATGEKTVLTAEKITLEIKLAESRRDKNHAAQSLQQATLRREAIETEKLLLQSEMTELEEQRKALSREEDSRSGDGETGEKLQLLERDFEHALNVQQENRAQISEYRVKNESMKERSRASVHEKARIQDDQNRLLELVLRLQQKAVRLEDQKAQLTEELESLTRELQENLDRKPHQETRTGQLASRLDREKTALAAIETELHDLEKQLSGKEAQFGEHRVRMAEIQSAMNTLEEQADWDVEGIADSLESLPDAEELTAWRTRLETLEKDLEKLGDVNLAAEAEHRELVERNTFLDEQIDDLETSINSLTATIQQINKTSKQKFIHAFTAVNQHFNHIFNQLFEGGEARLQLQDPDDPLESGFDIICNPPGKRARNIDLLSGGEKALTALALLLASFRYKPSPILFLDEVDAPLDDTNIVRFTQFLKELSETTQIMLITHNSLTMDAADILYGVTMPDPGISRLLSARIGML